MPLTLTNSRSWLERAKKVLACDGAQTLSKGHTRNPADYPIYIDHGKGSHVWDVDGNEYIDYVSALGPILLGYNYPSVTEAVIQQAKRGPLFSLEHPLTVEVAEQLVGIVPGVEQIRFTKTGSTAVEAAVRLARTYTGREIVLVAKGAYHGMSEWFQIKEGLGQGGIPKCLRDRIRDFTYNDPHSLYEAFRNSPEPVAAVILEPARDFIATDEFMDAARCYCHEYGALLILDEVVTFGRLPGLTGAPYFDCHPDLVVLGKAMASGYPLAAVCGPAEIMEAFSRCFISGTYHGEAVSLAAAKATLQILTTEPVVEHIHTQGEKLMAGFNGAMSRYDVPGKAVGNTFCWRPTFTGPRAEELRLAFMALCAERGVLPGLICYPSYSHSDADVLKTVQVYYQVAAELEKLLERPAGLTERIG